MKVTLSQLKQHALSASLFGPVTLRQAVEQFAFVQADPIRSPARAQDLILRQRVDGYRAGDLERHYTDLGLEEDFLYAYGFMPPSTWRLLHPRSEKALSPSERRVLEIVASHQHLHPRDLETYLGRRRQRNAWGGYSKATTRTLHTLHYRGALRVAKREKGIRLYEATTLAHAPLDPAERLRQLVLIIASILAPLPERSLQATLRHLAHGAPSLRGRGSVIKQLIKNGDLHEAQRGETRYVWPATSVTKAVTNERVRFLAPFDPLVWDRERFAQFWGWEYRFEAYTPLAKRKLGYYAMPILWREEVIGWVNVANKAGQVTVEAGFQKKKPTDAAFKNEYEAEVSRMKQFLRSEPKEAPPSVI